MLILITNDDGVHARGIRILKECLQEVANVWVVAPLEERSTTGHTVTLNDTLRIVPIEKQIFGCSGYPADCFLIGKGNVLKGQKIDLVVSGINRGANLGQDVFYSGTVAAAREASFHSVASIAISMACDFNKNVEDVNFFTAGKYLRNLIKNGIGHHILPGEFINLNVPDLELHDIKGIESAYPGKRSYSDEIDERVDCRGRKYFWIGGKYFGHDQGHGSDCSIVENGFVSLTPFNHKGHSQERMEDWSQILKDLRPY